MMEEREKEERRREKIRQIRELHERLWPSLMNATSTQEKKRTLANAMGFSYEEFKWYIKFLNLIDDLCLE